jgi:YidC/Oxa1 family membrane protein insertase
MWFDGTKAKWTGRCPISITNTTGIFFFPRTPKTEYRAGAGNVVWAAAHNQFFALLAMPKQPAAANRRASGHAAAVSPMLNWRRARRAARHPDGAGLSGADAGGEFQRSSGKSFFRRAEGIPDAGAHRRGISKPRGPGDEFRHGFFWGIFFAKPLLLAMNWLHDVTKMGYGWVIVLITVLMRAIFWPLTAASTRSMKRMQALAPEVKALKEKYKDDPQKFTQKQMELWKKNKVNPMSGCCRC